MVVATSLGDANSKDKDKLKRYNFKNAFHRYTLKIYFFRWYLQNNLFYLLKKPLFKLL